MFRWILAAALAACCCATASAQTPPADATDAVAYVNHARNLAQEALKPGTPPEQLRQAAAELERLRTLLDRQPYRDFSGGNMQLYAERLNIDIARAEIDVRLGDQDGALRALEASTGVALIPNVADMLARLPELAPLRAEPRFQAVLARHRQGAIMSHKGFASPYAETLTREQRIAGLSLFWSEVRHDFANVDLAPRLDWDAVYLDYLSRVEQADTTAAYYAVLMRLAPLLHDGHTNIYPPRELVSHFYAGTALQTALVEDAVVVTAVHDAQLARRVRPGDRIVAIDGIDAKAYAEQHVRPLVSSATEQDRNVRMYDYQLLHGDSKVPVALTLADAAGRSYTLSVPRAGWTDTPAARFPFKMLSGGIAYLRLDDFESDAGVKAFEAAWPAIRSAKGLILDVRTNGGGSTEFGTAILARLSDRPVQPTGSRVRFENQAFRAQAGDFVAWQLAPSARPAPVLSAERIFKGPVALLIGPKTFSAAEDFTAMFAQARRGALVGAMTAGSTGQPLRIELPGGGWARICVKRDTYEDGSEFVGRGIAPTLAVEPTIAALRTGQDPALQAAQALLLAHPEQYALAH